MKPESRSHGRRFPWLALLLLVATIVAFWVVPWGWRDKPIPVDFDSAPVTQP